MVRENLEMEFLDRFVLLKKERKNMEFCIFDRDYYLLRYNKESDNELQSKDG